MAVRLSVVVCGANGGGSGGSGGSSSSKTNKKFLLIKIT
jgi:hypothetical protein